LPRKKPSYLTEGELRIMKVVWEKEQATVAEVVASLPRNLNLAYKTVLTTMRILERKGYLRHVKAKDARAFVYSPVVGKVAATRDAVHHLLRRFFGDSAEALALNFLKDDALPDPEIRKIRDLLEKGNGDRT